MELDNLIISSSVVEVSESEDYLTLVNRVCFYNSPNLNGVQLDYDESSLDKAQTLVNMPVVASYVKKNGVDNLGGHNVTMTENGAKFGTQAIGVVTSVKIVEEEVSTVDGNVEMLPCLYSTQRIWTRFENATKAILRLFNEDNLHNSWELKSSAYSYKDGVKHIEDYAFIANCLLGDTTQPAYGQSAKILSISEEEKSQYEYMAAEYFAEALASDIESESPTSYIESERKEEKCEMENENIVEVCEEVISEKVAEEIVEETAEEVVEETVQESNEEVTSEGTEEEKETEEDKDEDEAQCGDDKEKEKSETSSALTDTDVYRLVAQAINNVQSEHYYWLSMLFPEEHIALAHSWCLSELQFIKYDYRIENEEAVLSNEELVEFTISPLNFNSEIEKKNDAIIKSNEEISMLKKQVEELSTYKEQIDLINAEKEKAEHDAKVSALREYVVNSSCFTKKELESEEVCSAIENLNEGWLKSQIADRYVKKVLSKKDTNEVSESKSFAMSINNYCSSEDVMKAFFGK